MGSCQKIFDKNYKKKIKIKKPEVISNSDFCNFFGPTLTSYLKKILAYDVLFLSFPYSKSTSSADFT